MYFSKAIYSTCAELLLLLTRQKIFSLNRCPLGFSNIQLQKNKVHNVKKHEVLSLTTALQPPILTTFSPTSPINLWLIS